MFPRDKFQIGGEARYSAKHSCLFAARVKFMKNHASWAYAEYCQCAEVKVAKKHFAAPPKDNKLLFWVRKVPVKVKDQDPQALPGDSIEEPSLICVHWPGKKNNSVFELCVAHVDSVGDKFRLEYGKFVGMVEKINTRVDAFIGEQLQAQDGGMKLLGSVQGAQPTKPFVKQEMPTPVPVRISS